MGSICIDTSGCPSSCTGSCAICIAVQLLILLSDKSSKLFLANNWDEAGGYAPPHPHFQSAASAASGGIQNIISK